jgi:hypothetical protein
LFINKITDVNNVIQEFANILRLAQNKTLSSENSSQYGVYLDNVASPNKYTLFKGESYALRDVSADQIYSLPESAEFFEINLGGSNEVVFIKLTGQISQPGDVSIRLKSDTSQVKSIYLDNSGAISFASSSSPSDVSRIKDSRHLHFDYSRNINTASENITLNFNNGSVVQTFPISDHIADGQIKWSGTFSVNGSDQTIEISTHKLNSPETQFSIKRDRRLNDKAVKITISNDSSGYLVNYSADGLTTDFTSLYVSNLNWQ